MSSHPKPLRGPSPTFYYVTADAPTLAPDSLGAHLASCATCRPIRGRLIELAIRVQEHSCERCAEGELCRRLSGLIKQLRHVMRQRRCLEATAALERALASADLVDDRSRRN